MGNSVKYIDKNGNLYSIAKDISQVLKNISEKDTLKYLDILIDELLKSLSKEIYLLDELTEKTNITRKLNDLYDLKIKIGEQHGI